MPENSQRIMTNVIPRFAVALAATFSIAIAAAGRFGLGPKQDLGELVSEVIEPGSNSPLDARTVRELLIHQFNDITLGSEGILEQPFSDETVYRVDLAATGGESAISSGVIDFSATRRTGSPVTFTLEGEVADPSQAIEALDSLSASGLGSARMEINSRSEFNLASTHDVLGIIVGLVGEQLEGKSSIFIGSPWAEGKLAPAFAEDINNLLAGVTPLDVNIGSFFEEERVVAASNSFYDWVGQTSNISSLVTYSFRIPTTRGSEITGAGYSLSVTFTETLDEIDGDLVYGTSCNVSASNIGTSEFGDTRLYNFGFNIDNPSVCAQLRNQLEAVNQR